MFPFWPNVTVTEESGQIETKYSDTPHRIVNRETPMQLKIQRALRQAHSAVIVAVIVGTQRPTTPRRIGRDVLDGLAKTVVFHMATKDVTASTKTQTFNAIVSTVHRSLSLGQKRSFPGKGYRT
jgi:hypothetical protein